MPKGTHDDDYLCEFKSLSFVRIFDEIARQGWVLVLIFGLCLSEFQARFLLSLSQYAGFYHHVS